MPLFPKYRTQAVESRLMYDKLSSIVPGFLVPMGLCLKKKSVVLVGFWFGREQKLTCAHSSAIFKQKKRRTLPEVVSGSRKGRGRQMRDGARG